MLRTHRAALDFDQRFCNIVLNTKPEVVGRVRKKGALNKKITFYVQCFIINVFIIDEEEE